MKQTVEAWIKAVGDFIKQGSIFVHQHEVRADRKDTVLGTVPVLHAQEGNLEALALIHEPVGGASYITSTVNTNYHGAVGTALRNRMRPNNPKKVALNFADSLADLGFQEPAFYTLLNYGSSQELDAIIKDCNRKLKDLDAEWSEAKANKDKARLKAIIKERADINKVKSEREIEIELGLTD
jgi:hypothetical protein